MINEATIQAQFKQATVKGSVATLQFEILTDNADAFRIIKQSGKTVLLTVAEQQQAMDFDDETGEIYGQGNRTAAGRGRGHRGRGHHA